MMDLTAQNDQGRTPIWNHAFAVSIVLLFCEMRLWQFFRTETEVSEVLYTVFGSYSILLLALPVIIWVFIPVMRWMDRKVNRKAIFMKVAHNKLEARLINDDTRPAAVSLADFSWEGELIYDADVFGHAAYRAILDLFKHERLSGRPYVLFSVDRPLSPVQLKALTSGLEQAGSIHVQALNNDATLEDARAHVQKYPFSTFKK